MMGRISVLKRSHSRHHSDLSSTSVSSMKVKRINEITNTSQPVSRHRKEEEWKRESAMHENERLREELYSLINDLPYSISSSMFVTSKEERDQTVDQYLSLVKKKHCNECRIDKLQQKASKLKETKETLTKIRSVNQQFEGYLSQLGDREPS